MNFQEFKANPKFDAKVIALNGDEAFFKFMSKTIILKVFPEADKVYVDTEMDAGEFYEKVEPNEIIPQPKIIYVDSSEVELSKFKSFWSTVRTSDKDIKYILNECKAKDIPKDIPSLEITCSRMKDSPREIGVFVEELIYSLGLIIDRKNVPYFHHLYHIQRVKEVPTLCGKDGFA